MNPLKNASCASAVAAGALVLVSLSGGAASANPAAVAGGAAAVEATVRVVEALSKWLEDQSDDCAAAAAASAAGKHVNFQKSEDQDTGFYSAIASASKSNDAGVGVGRGVAEEGILGAWASSTVNPSASASVRALHNNVQGDWHKAYAWAKAQVDGKAKAETDQTPDVRSASDDAGAVFLDVTAPEVTLNAAQREEQYGKSRGRWDLSVRVDGEEVFGGRAILDGAGQVTVSGDFSASMFATELLMVFDPESGQLVGQWVTSLTTPVLASIQIGQLDMGERAGDSQKFHIRTISSISGWDSEAVPTPGSAMLGAIALLTMARRKRN